MTTRDFRKNADALENQNSTAVALFTAALFLSALLLSSDVGRSVWPAGHATITHAVASVLGEREAEVSDGPLFEAVFAEEISAGAAEAAPEAWAEAHPLGAEVCVLRGAEAAAAGYCARLEAYDAPSRRALVQVTRLVRVAPGSVVGRCASVDGVQLGDRLWIDQTCAK